jgi:hypothetical protein
MDRGTGIGAALLETEWPPDHGPHERTVDVQCAVCAGTSIDAAISLLCFGERDQHVVQEQRRTSPARQWLDSTDAVTTLRTARRRAYSHTYVGTPHAER